MVLNADAFRGLGPQSDPRGTPAAPGSGVGACFQLALLAAAQGNDQEAGDYLREIISSMKAMARPGETDAGRGPAA